LVRRAGVAVRGRQPGLCQFVLAGLHLSCPRRAVAVREVLPAQRGNTHLLLGHHERRLPALPVVPVGTIATPGRRPCRGFLRAIDQHRVNPLPNLPQESRSGDEVRQLRWDEHREWLLWLALGLVPLCADGDTLGRGVNVLPPSTLLNVKLLVLPAMDRLFNLWQFLARCPLSFLNQDCQRYSLAINARKPQSQDWQPE